MDWSLSKMIRIENAQNSISINDLRELLRLYEITDKDKTAEFITLARAARKQGWWGSYGKVAPKTLLTLIEYESAASSIRQFETTFIPGILQTKEYARAVLQNFYADEPAAEMVELRTRREGLLRRDGAPQYFFMLDEPVIERLAGGPVVMRSQLQRLIDATELPNVTIQVVPLSAGLHPGVGGPFELIQFPDQADRDVVFFETRGRDIISDDPDDTLNSLNAFERIEKLSLSPADSAALINEIIKGSA
jgi:hypothetical protein